MHVFQLPGSHGQSSHEMTAVAGGLSSLAASCPEDVIPKGTDGSGERTKRNDSLSMGLLHKGLAVKSTVLHVINGHSGVSLVSFHVAAASLPPEPRHVDPLPPFLLTGQKRDPEMHISKNPDFGGEKQKRGSARGPWVYRRIMVIIIMIVASEYCMYSRDAPRLVPLIRGWSITRCICF